MPRDLVEPEGVNAESDEAVREPGRTGDLVAGGDPDAGPTGPEPAGEALGAPPDPAEESYGSTP